LQQTVFQRAICHLFAVVVHSGKNSNSGHYVAYVNTNDEWWLLDDARVVRSSWDEVCNAEAYILFYRFTSHPVATSKEYC
jgi:ubiquitin C-terminal hydrolase